MISDKYSGQHSTQSSAAVAHFESAVRALAEHRPGANEAIDAALAEDPNLVAGLALRGFVTLLLARPEFDAQVRTSLHAAVSAAQARSITHSECALIEALAAASEEKLLEAAARLEAYLVAEPRDFLALKLAHGLRFMSGDLTGMLRATASVLGDYLEDTPASGFLYGCHAFALEEAGVFDEAERFGRIAVDREPLDAWGLHAVAHVFEMQGRSRAGVSWLENKRERWSGCNIFGGHVSWHLALFHIEAGDFERALALYDLEIYPSPTEDYRDIANATTLLWRLGQFGVDVGDRWDDLVEIAQRRAHETKLLFSTMHHLLSLLACGMKTEARESLKHVMQFAADGRGDQAQVAREVAVDLARALIGASDGDKLDIVRVANSLPKLGGSHAQRDVFIRSLAMSAAKMGDNAAFSQIMTLRHRYKKADQFTAFAQSCRDTTFKTVECLAHV